MLIVTDLKVSYGAIAAIKGVSFEVREGEIVSLIGANGAGKTTILHALTGLIGRESGSVHFMEHDLDKVAPHNILGLGLAHVPEGRRTFGKMTVAENLSLGGYLVTDDKKMEKGYERAYQLFPRLYERRKQLAGTLSGGEQQMLAIARALMTEPKMLLMDEPSMGLSPILVKEIFTIIQDCKDSGMTILLVEQNANMALSISDRAYVLENGKVVIEGPASDLMGDEKVKKAYLGG